jgi:asparagine synthase (glutamine-hydrolysing)
MCGIVGALSLAKGERLDEGLAAIRHRGPDARAAWRGSRFWLGHTRLAIIDTSAASEQPYRYGDVVLTYNGEIWNYVALRAELAALGRVFTTTGDTEVLAAALAEWGEAALPRLEGMFAFAWTSDGGETITLARDRFGETPFHVFEGRSFFAFASEVKALRALGVHPAGIGWLEPGTLLRVDREGRGTRRRWYELPDYAARYEDCPEDGARAIVRSHLRAGALERTISDVPVCMLLSGGIDSAAIAYELTRQLPGIVAYTATLEGARSIDLPPARAVAERLGVELREVVVPRPTADDLAGIVRSIETDSKAQVEIGWACFHLARQMRADGFRVTFSGEGSDELWASYGTAHHGIEAKGWYGFRRGLFLGQHRKNFARCNKVFMAAGVECRLPFLNTRLVETALSLPRRVVRADKRLYWKKILQEGYRDALPAMVIDRYKTTFQDGMRLLEATASAAHDPARYYRAVLRDTYGEVDL